jgi:hypothetical protein
VNTLRMKSAFVTLASAAFFAALLVGSVTPARASATNHTQAVRVARSYLQYQGFSFLGLVDQLKFEGFSTSDARYGASHVGANWFKQAVRVAKSYLAYQGFSYKGLVEQLEFEKFTPAQAAYGAHGAGL